jgi:hypothetical protein
MILAISAFEPDIVEVLLREDRVDGVGLSKVYDGRGRI